MIETKLSFKDLKIISEPIVEYFKSLDESSLKQVIKDIGNWGRKRQRNPFTLTNNLAINPDVYDIINSIDLSKEKSSFFYRLLFVYNPLRYSIFLSRPKFKTYHELYDWINNTVIPMLNDFGYNPHELVDIDYVKQMSKQLEKFLPAMTREGFKTFDGKYARNLLSLPELYIAGELVYGFEKDIDIKLRWYAFAKDIPIEDLKCPYCKTNWRNYTRDKIQNTKYDRLSTTCGSDECYAKFRSNYMKSLDVNPSQREDVKKKKAETFKKHYGVDNIFKRSDLMKEYWENKLGVDNPTKHIDIKAKASQKACETKGNIITTFCGKQYKLYKSEVDVLNYLKRNYKPSCHNLKVQKPVFKYTLNNEPKVYIADFLLLNKYILEAKQTFDLTKTTYERWKVTELVGYEFIMIICDEKDIVGVYIPSKQTIWTKAPLGLKEDTYLDAYIIIDKDLTLHKILVDVFKDDRLENPTKEDVTWEVILNYKEVDEIDVGKIEL